MALAVFPQVEVVSFSHILLVGLRVRTDMEKAPLDGPRLWEQFLDRSPELAAGAGKAQSGLSFGVSIMFDFEKGIFDYWAGMPLPENMKLPAGMEELNIPGGFYVGCTVQDQGILDAAYEYIYNDWAKSNPQYVVNVLGACLERYGEGYASSGSLELLVPLLIR